MADVKLPTDAFDLALSRLIGLPNGAHTQATVRQSVDFYGNTTQYVIQTVRHDQGDTTFITQINAAGSSRYILPPEVLETVTRQRDAVSTMVRRRHGKRLAAERAMNGDNPLLRPEVQAKARAARAAKAAKRTTGNRNRGM